MENANQRIVTLQEFKDLYNVRIGTMEHNCGNCIYGYCHESTLPSVGCKAAERLNNGHAPLLGTCYINEENPGGICDLFSARKAHEVKISKEEIVIEQAARRKRKNRMNFSKYY